MKALGEAASEVPWLVPGAAALVQWTRSDAWSVWNWVRFDPGAVCLAVRSTPAAGTPFPALLSQPTILENAQAFLDRGSAPFVDWNRSGPNVVYRKSLQMAELARELARTLGRCDPDRAWVAGLLAPLGWLAVCAADPRAVVEHLGEFAEHGHCARWQCEKWGLDHSDITRRLSRRWRLPSWLASVIDYLGLPFDIGCRLGADPVLFQVVQLAVSLCQRDDPGLGLIVGTRFADLLKGLDLSTVEANRLVQTVRSESPPPLLDWQPPSEQPLLADLLRLALEVSGHRQERREQECRPANFSRTGLEEEQLHAQKMAAMAELAAGAGHEINNPLAVISGQAQYIARQLEQAQELVPEEPALGEYVETLAAGIGRSLKTIVGQSQRIHQVLLDLMAFARPAPPRPEIVHVRQMLREVAATVENLAHARKVRVLCPDVADTWRISCDLNQTRTALVSLLRNAVDAAPPDGWAGLRAEMCGPDSLKIVVEDNGPGPLPAVREHMFDPFYSGRSAGRGRGLGLSIAWRLIAQQGGELSFDGHVEAVTRFALTLPGLVVSYAAPESNGKAHHSLEEVLVLGRPSLQHAV